VNKMTVEKEYSAKTILNLVEPYVKFEHEMEIPRAKCKECTKRGR
jgi:hypothetical protein